MSLLERLAEFRTRFDEEEMECVEEMLLKSAAYVRKVVEHRVAVMNLLGRTGSELREFVERADSDRTSAHNALIIAVNIVNRICAMHNLPLIYTGGSERRYYGDFAIELTKEIFDNRYN